METLGSKSNDSMSWTQLALVCVAVGAGAALLGPTPGLEGTALLGGAPAAPIGPELAGISNSTNASAMNAIL